MAKILIVDDEPVNRDILIAFLDDSGHELIEAGNGQEALDQVAKHAPDLLLLDIMMPELDGFEVIRRLRASVTEWVTRKTAPMPPRPRTSSMRYFAAIVSPTRGRSLSLGASTSRPLTVHS